LYVLDQIDGIALIERTRAVRELVDAENDERRQVLLQVAHRTVMRSFRKRFSAWLLAGGTMDMAQVARLSVVPRDIRT
jgi:hypothetical protein